MRCRTTTHRPARPPGRPTGSCPTGRNDRTWPVSCPVAVQCGLLWSRISQPRPQSLSCCRPNPGSTPLKPGKGHRRGERDHVRQQQGRPQQVGGKRRQISDRARAHRAPAAPTSSVPAMLNRSSTRSDNSSANGRPVRLPGARRPGRSRGWSTPAGCRAGPRTWSESTASPDACDSRCRRVDSGGPDLVVQPDDALEGARPARSTR